MEDISALSNLIQTAQTAAEEALKKQTDQTQDASQESKANKLKRRVEETLGMNFKAPKYDILYKQQVEASEVYGAFQQMTPSTMDSQFLLIRIYLPNEVLSNIDIELTEQTLTLFSKYHRLHLELPHPIIEKSSKAKWVKNMIEITVKRSDLDQ